MTGSKFKKKRQKEICHREAGEGTKQKHATKNVNMMMKSTRMHQNLIQIIIYLFIFKLTKMNEHRMHKEKFLRELPKIRKQTKQQLT